MDNIKLNFLYVCLHLSLSKIFNVAQRPVSFEIKS